jgi:hypothetical protein
MVSYSPNAAAVLCFARVGCEDIRQEFGVRASNEVLCELANGRVINRELLREIANRLFEGGQGKAIQKGLVVDISRSDLAARKKEFAWGEYDIPESMGIPAPTKVPFSKFDLERDIVDRMLRLLGYGRFSLIDPNAGQKNESGADVLAKFDDHRIAFQVRQYHSDVDGNTGTRGSSLRREESRKAAVGLLAPAFIKPISMPALVHLLQEKAKKGWSQKEFPDMRLLIAASIPQSGGTGATFLFEALLKVDDLNAQLSPILEGTKYSAAYLYVMMLESVYEWTRESGWKYLPKNAQNCATSIESPC